MATQIAGGSRPTAEPPDGSLRANGKVTSIVDVLAANLLPQGRPSVSLSGTAGLVWFVCCSPTSA